MTITLDQARAVIDAAEDKARSIGNPMCIAVVDDGGHLVAFSRMDNAWRGSVDIAINKAWTARAFDMPTSKLKDIAQPGKICFGIDATNNGKVVIFDGGVPLATNDGVIVGAIGVSGGLADTQDKPVAEAGAQAFLSLPSTSLRKPSVVQA